MLYGATPIEDIIGYNQIVRSLTEWTGASTEGTMCQTSINDGIGGYVMGRSGCLSGTSADNTGAAAQSALPGLVNARQAYIHGVSTVSSANAGAYPTPPTGMGFGVVPNGNPNNPITIASGATNNSLITSTNPRKRYQIQFALGLFNQAKLIPTKFMASQLAIEITLANPAECMIAKSLVVGFNNPSYSIENVNLIPEILEFDASYDEMFLKGLMNGGVPIKFSTWNNYKSVSASSSVNIQIQERSRSVKSIFALQRRDPVSFGVDSGASFFSTGTAGIGVTPTGGFSTLQEYQYRIGGRY